MKLIVFNEPTVLIDWPMFKRLLGSASKETLIQIVKESGIKAEASELRKASKEHIIDFIYDSLEEWM